jgi:SAM-dependent methyltransferase
MATFPHVLLRADPRSRRELEAGGFFDDPLFLRTVREERTDNGSATEALAAASLAGCEPGTSVLDAGCGNGRHAVPLARAGYHVVALDRSPLLLAAARGATNGALWPRFVLGCYSRLPFRTGRFDGILSLGTSLGYLGDHGDRRALSEFHRVLSPGGRLVVETLHRGELEAGFAAHEDRALPGGATLRVERDFDPRVGVMRELQSLRNDLGWGPERVYEMRVYGARELCSMLIEAGFGRTECYGSLSGTGPSTPATGLVVVAHKAQAPAS